MTVLVDLPAVRPGRLAERISAEEATEPVRALRAYLRGAQVTELPEGVRLRFRLDDTMDIARLADEIRGLASEWPFLSFVLATEPPECSLAVTGLGAAAGMARTVFAELGAQPSRHVACTVAFAMHALVVAFLLFARVQRAPTTPLPSAGEAPTAADLLRAKRMADEAASRLQLRAPKRGGWIRGGNGWERPSAAHDERAPTRKIAR